jgi:putative ABC transport system permease protein
VTPRWVRAIGWVIARRYRDEVLADLVEERARHLANGRLPWRASLWLAAEIVRSARASRRAPPEIARREGAALSTIAQDIRYALRYFRRRPGFTAVALATLTLGIGVNLAAFAVLNATLRQPLPFPDPDAIVRIWEGEEEPLNPANLVNLRHATREAFRYFAAWRTSTRVTLTGTGAPVIVPVVDATPDLFRVMGVAPAAGRVLTDDDVADDAKVVVISHRFWQSHYQARPDILGGAAMLDGLPWTIVGVMPAGIAMPETDIWRPLIFTPAMLAQRDTQYLNAVARLHPGVSAERANAMVKAAMAAISGANGAERTAMVVDFRRSSTSFVQAQILFAQGITALVLLIAVANLSHLLLAAFSARRDEIAIRQAIGASRGRVLRQLAVESLVLAGAGSALAIVIAAWILPAIVSSYPGVLPRRGEITVSVTEWVFAFAIAAAAAIASTVAPALIATRSGVAGMRAPRATAGPTARWLQQTLLVAEVAIALSLLTGAGLLVRSLAILTDQPLGFSPVGVVTTEIALPGRRYPTPESRVAFFTTLFARLHQLPSIASASGGSIIPFDRNESAIGLLGEPPGGNARVTVGLRVVTPDYLEAMQMTLRQGRFLADSDVANAPLVAVVNEAFVRRYAMEHAPTAMRLRQTLTSPWIQIVGVVGDLRPSYQREPRPEMFFSIAQMPASALRLTLRAGERAATMAEDFSRTLANLDKDLAAPALQTYGALMNRSVAERRFNRGLLTSLAGLATLLAAVGIYGVMSHVVAMRRREVGVRLALGARPDQVIGLVVRHGLVPVVLGVVLGLGGAWLLRSLLESQLYRIAAHDPWTMTGAAMLFLVIALLACWVPARRTSRVDPVSVLRAE